MAKYIIGLIPFSETFRNAIAWYCQETQGGATPERNMQILTECTSQVCHKMDRDANAFMLNLMELPYWGTINFTDVQLNGEAAEQFRNAFRTYAMALWEELVRKTPGDENYAYILETCTISVAIIGLYVDADQV